MCTNSFLFTAFASIQGRYITHLLPYEDASSYEQPCYEPVCMSNGTDKKAEQESLSYKKAKEWDEEFQRHQKIIENEVLRATLQKDTGALSINEEAYSKEKENDMDNYKEERTTGGKVSRSLSFKENLSYKKSEEEDEEFYRLQKMFENEVLRATLQRESGTLSINEEADSKEKVNNMDNYKEDRTTGDKISGNISHKEAEEMLENIFENEALRATLKKESGTLSINDKMEPNEKVSDVDNYKKAEEGDEEFQRHQKIIENEALRATLQKETGALSINEEADSKEKENDMGNYKEERTTGGKVSRSLSFKGNINHRSTSSEEKNSHIIYKRDKKAEEGVVSYKKSEEEDEEFYRLQNKFENEALRATLQRESGTLSINEEADSKEKVNNMDSYKEDRTTGDKISGNIAHKEAEEMLENIFENETLGASLEKESGTLSINEEMESNEKVSDVDNYKEERTTGDKASESLSFMENINHSSASSEEKNTHVIYKHDQKVEEGAVSDKKAEGEDEKFYRLQKMFEYEALRAALQKENRTLSTNKESDSKENVNNMDNYKEEKTTGDKSYGFL